MQEDPAAILEIKEDIREECEKLGEVTNVVLFDKEPDGVASVRFGNAQAAEACVRASKPLVTFKSTIVGLTVYQLMNGRWFDERQLEAHIADGSEKFKKSNEKKADVDEEDGEGEGEGDRLDKFGSWLENEKKKQSEVA